MPIYNGVTNQKGTPAFYSDTFANRPAFGYAGRLFISTDSGQIFEDTGTAWTLIADAGVGGGTLSSVCLNGNTTASGIVITAGGLSSTTGTFSGIVTTPEVKASTSAGLSFNANSGTQIAVMGAGGGANMTLLGGLTGTTGNFSGNVSAISFDGTSADGNYFLRNEDVEFRNHAISNSYRLVGRTNSNISYIYFGDTGTTYIGYTGSIFNINSNTNISSGSLGIGTSSLTGYSLRLAKNITGAVTSYGISSEGVIQSDAITNGWYYNSTASTAAASFTVGNIVHYFAQQGTFGAGSSVTRQYGIFIAGNLIGATNNYGLYSDIPSGTNRWNLYMNGTANNYMAGKLLIGSTTDSGELIQINGTSKFGGQLSITSSFSTTTSAISIYNNSASNALNIAQLDFRLNNSFGGNERVASIIALNPNATTNNGGALVFSVSANGTGTTPTEDLRIGESGVVTIINLAGTGSRTVLADANGNLSAPVSDISVKENVKAIGYGLNEIIKMNPVWFDYIDEYKNYGKGRQNGNIAQEMAMIIPEAVFITPSTSKMGINYDQLHSVYIKAIQELNNKIEQIQYERNTTSINLV